MRSFKHELQELPLFAETSRAEIAAIARQLTLLSVPAGTVLVREETRGDEFMIIVEGEAEVRQGDRPIATIGRGGLVGEMALWQHGAAGKRNATVTALSDALIYVGSRREFRQIIEAAPSVAEKIEETVASRMLDSGLLNAA